MKVEIVDKNIPLSLLEIVRFQITLHCFINSIKISPAQLNTLAYLGLWGEINISDFCDQIVDEGIFGNPQTVRNFILKSIAEGHVVRKGTGNKLIELSEDIELTSEGNIILKLNVYHVQTNQG